MKNIVTVTDNNYLLGTMVMLQSLYKNTNLNKEINIYIIYDEDDLSELNIKKLENFLINKFLSVNFFTSSSYKKIKNSYLETFKDQYRHNGWGFSVLLQGFISDALPDNVDKIYYIDSDTVFIRNADEFLNLKLNLPIAAQLDPGVGSQYENPVSPYFNAGVFVTSLNFWRENDLINKFMQIDDFAYSQFHAQNFLNKQFLNNWQILGPQINVTREMLGIEMYIHDSNIMEKQNFIFHKNPILVHYFGHPKPWTKDHWENISNNWRSNGKEIWVDKYYQEILKEVE